MIFCFFFLLPFSFSLKQSYLFKLDLSETFHSSPSASIQPKSKHLQMLWCNIPPKVHKGGTVQALSCRHQWTAQCMYSLQGLWSAYAIVSVCSFYWHREKIQGKKNEGRPSSVRLFSLSLLEKTLLTWFFFFPLFKKTF